MNAYQVYRQTQATTAAPGELVVMLYRGALRFLAAGIEGIEQRDIQRAHNNLLKTQAIILELITSLDTQRGGELAKNLAAIYHYLNRRLIEANLRKDAEPAHEVQKHLRELLEAWEAAAKQAPAPGRALAGAAA